MTTYEYRVLSNNSRILGGNGIAAGRRFKSRYTAIAAWPAHLASPESDATLCGLDATEFGEFDDSPDRVARRDRCERCYGSRTLREASR